MKMNSTRAPAPAPAPAVPPLPAIGAEPAPGYLTSSFELRAGLEVSAIALSQLPAEVLRELLRLRESWRAASLPLAA